jgi:hypothetical protein
MLGMVGRRPLQADRMARPRAPMTMRIEQRGARAAGPHIDGQQDAVMPRSLRSACFSWTHGARYLTWPHHRRTYADNVPGGDALDKSIREVTWRRLGSLRPWLMRGLAGHGCRKALYRGPPGVRGKLVRKNCRRICRSPSRG